MAQQNQTNNFDENVKDWIVYWRQNIHRFVIEYMGVKLSTFQQILLYLMDAPYSNKLHNFIFFASRGLGKTFLCDIYCIAKCILYPGIYIKVSSSQFSQATAIIKYAMAMQETYPNIANEIEDCKAKKDGAFIKFKNGSKVESISCNDGAKGERCNILILDESRLMDVHDVKDILEPFLTRNERGEPWDIKTRMKYHAEHEHNSIIKLTSIGAADEPSYEEFKKFAYAQINGDQTCVAVSIPYYFGIEAGFINRSYIENVIKESQDDIKVLRQNFEVIPFSENENSVLTYKEMNEARGLITPLVPPTDKQWIECKGDLRKLSFYQRKDTNVGEIRLISMDIAVSSGNVNDNSVITVMRLFPQGDYYNKEVAYIEPMNGVNLDVQMLRLKQLYYDLECDYAIIDGGGGLGIVACNLLGGITRDVVRGITYPGWKSCNYSSKVDTRVTDPNAVPVLYAYIVSGGSSSDVYVGMITKARLDFERKRVSLLKRFDDVEEDVNYKFKYIKLRSSNDSDDIEFSNNIMTTYVNTNELIKESVNTILKKLPSGRYTIEEGGGRKDRFMSLLYSLDFANKLEQDLSVMNKKIDISAYGKHVYTNSTQAFSGKFTGFRGRFRGFSGG